MSIARLSAKLCLPNSHHWGIDEGEPTHWCPACRGFHTFHVNKRNRSNAIWKWDGNKELPTFDPSMNIRIGPFLDGHLNICHYFLRAGMLQFLPDCTHASKGQLVPLPDIPEVEWCR